MICGESKMTVCACMLYRTLSYVLSLSLSQSLICHIVDYLMHQGRGEGVCVGEVRSGDVLFSVAFD